MEHPLRKNSESLDRCIQTTLSALYPPFQSSSSTLLCQVLSVVDRCYRGDGLRYLFHFLLPAKQLLLKLQHDACVQYCGLVFRHEGWPLCVHEKIVVQLCHLDQRLLRPGDFYLLVSPPLSRAQSASCRSAVASRLLLCSASVGSHHVEQQEVSEIALSSLFSMAWLDSINRERELRGASKLERCLLAAQDDVFRVPWEDLVYPQFISRPWTSLEYTSGGAKGKEVSINTPHTPCRVSDTPTENVIPMLSLPSVTKRDQSQASSEGEDSEGEYVELAELPLPCFSPQKGSLTQSIRVRTSAHTPQTSTASAHTPQPTNTHATGAACSSCQDFSSSFSQEPRATPNLSPCSSSLSALPELAVTFSCEVQRRTPEEQVEGTDFCRSLMLRTDHTVPKDQREEVDTGEEVVGEGELWEQEVREEDREVVPVVEKPKEKHEMEVSADEGKEEEDGQLEYERDKDLLLQTLSSEDEDQEDNSEGTDMGSDEDGDHQLEEDGAEEVEVEEEVQEIILHQSQERRQEEQVQKGDESEKKEEEGGEMQIDENVCKDSFFEKNTEKRHTKDLYSEKKIQQPCTEYSDSKMDILQTQRVDSYFETNALLTHNTDFNSEKSAEQKHAKGCYCERNAELTGSSGCEIDTGQTYCQDSYSEDKRPQTLNGDSYFEKNSPQSHTEDSYFERNEPQTDGGKTTPPTPSDDFNCEKDAGDRNMECFYSERCFYTEQKHPEDSYCEKASQACTGGSSTDPSEEPQTAQGDPNSLWKESKEEVEEESRGEEGGVGGAAKPQIEGTKQLPVGLSTGPTEPEPPAASPQLQSSQSGFYSVLLRSGAVCMPGSRDRRGRALLAISTRSSVWSNPDCDSAHLLHLFLYYGSTLREEVRTLGLTVLVDAREAAPVPHLFSALKCLQENAPGSVHSVLLLVNKDTHPHVHTPAAIQVEVFRSLRSLQRTVDLQQLPVQFGGSQSFSQSSWLAFRSRLGQLRAQCVNVIHLLQKAVDLLQTTPLPSAAQDAQLLLSRYRTVMCSILEDSRLVQLQQEGGASLSRLRSVSVTEDERVALGSVSALYDQVDELLHRLVTLSNCRTQELSFIMDFISVEQGFGEVMSWLQEVGEVRLKLLDQPEDSLELLQQRQKDFKDFHTAAYERCHRGEELLRSLERWSNLSSADLQDFEVKGRTFWARLQDFSHRVRTTGHSIERAVQLYRFLDQAYGWALEGMRHLAGITMEDCTLPEKCQAVIGCLEEYQRQHPPILEARFQEMKVVAGELRGERGLHQWSFAWSKCQETSRVFNRKMEAALKTRDSTHRQRSDSSVSRGSASIRKTAPPGLWGSSDTSPSTISCPPEEDGNASGPSRTSSFSVLHSTSTPAATPRHTPLLRRFFRSTSIEDATKRLDICSSSPSLPHLGSSTCSSPRSSFSSSRRQQLRKTQSFDCPPAPEVLRYGPRTLAEPVRRGNTGVFIRGLEVSSTEAADRTLCPRTAAHAWAGQGLCSPGTPRTTGNVAPEPRPRGSKLQHIVEEMVTTEREYVRSLDYIVHHYFPEMERSDLPQDLRGKRSVVFGNLEKLLDFHSQFFLKELEACWRHPLRVPHCFIRHQEQFGLYALYSKNKPKSDALLANHGTAFFRKKQVELGDKMDLSSYLLKPVQRMSKYALLLTDLMKEVGVAQEAELTALLTATNMVKFQLRHGNDLLAMDAIRDCDVNLKEQGQLIRQDEFTVWAGRRKCQRHVFLFEELVLFSKPKKIEGGLDVFIYKHSFKTADVGLTESTGDSGLRFEIWFRRRTSKNLTFTLQATTEEVKQAWTAHIARILWTQATRNKELRLKEMVSMGVGNKPFLDIQPSDAAISDRAVHCIMKSRGARTRASIAVSAFDHSNPFQRGAVTSDCAPSGPSSSSLLGPLNLHMYSHALSAAPVAEGSFITSSIEEDEQEHETSSQPSMTTESSGSSSRCQSGSTGSDSGCVSAHLQEAFPDEPSRHSRLLPSDKQHLDSQYISARAAAVMSPATIV